MKDIVDIMREYLLQNEEVYPRLMEKVYLSDGHILFHQGDPGDAFYLIETGSIKIFILDVQGKPMTLNTLSPGETLGELALLDAQPRSASSIAVGDCTLLRLSRERFLEQLRTSPTWMNAIIKLLSERSRHMTKYIQDLGRWSRLIINGDYHAVLTQLEKIDAKEDKALVAVADSLRQMVKAVSEREELLRQEVAQLKIQIKIDQEQKEQQIREITDTDSFDNLLKRAEKIRKNKESNS